MIVALLSLAVGFLARPASSGDSKGNLDKAQAYWLSRDTVGWSLPGFHPNWVVRLHSDASGGLSLTADGVAGGTVIPLVYDPAGLPAAIKAKFPHLSNLLAFRIPEGRVAEVPSTLKGQTALSAVDGDGKPVDATSLQIPGVLDDLYSYDGPLGVTFEKGVPTLRLWAPTARSVRLQLFGDSNPTTSPAVLDMVSDPASGVWSVAGDASWYGKYFTYDVEVFVRTTGHVEHNVVTDPYSVSLSTNSRRSQIVDLSDAKLKPPGWDALVKPPLEAPEDIVLYELHVRDFSANDRTVPAPLRGTFEAFTVGASNGMKHLAALSKAGLTHVHVLPAFDIASVNEDKSTWQSPAGDLSSFPPDSTQQQAAVGAVASKDGYNWGYDPLHYTVPEGSYSTNPDGPTRVREFRDMVRGLNGVGLRVVMDVVYNHTSAAGQDPASVLDRIVPGYYHRLNANGDVETSSCCSNTASEHNMMEKLLVDSVVSWAKQYKVDGFRFDLMGHHMKHNLVKLRQALDSLTLAHDGVDGAKIYLYGEGWNFGEVANDARGVNAVQRNMAGTGIGTFNDRIRDGARGGGPFSGLQEQGFVNGLFYDPNATNQGSLDDQKARLQLEEDWIRASLAGNLSTYHFVDRTGHTVAANQIDYNGQPAGYTADPQEAINYVEAHDNDTLFDATQLKAPIATSLADRVRIQELGLSIVMLAQGIPFVHAGSEILRSKSLDRNSFNSGDWFNTLDYSYTTNNWGVGLPPAADNKSNWPVMQPLLANRALRPSKANIVAAFDGFRELLRIRKSSKLFRLRSAADVNSRVAFLNTGPTQIPGLIVMALSDADGTDDRAHSLVVVLFNANDEPATFQTSSLAGRALSLHPVQAASADPVVRRSTFSRASGTFVVPARTTAVFVSSTKSRRP